MFKKTLAVASIISTTFISGCASIVSEDVYPVAINSTPTASKFVIRNEAGQTIHQGSTPETVTLNAGNGYFSGADYTITFSREGYNDLTVNLESSVDGWYWGNILFGGLIGMLIVDPATGAMYKLPTEVNSDLSQNANQLSIRTLDTVAPNDLPKLVKLN
ncbi:hypothetical protein KCM76_02240 [Zooshikella marina]|uniref:PEGA domain-containing protein n=1 Tax=Zooshikella ganghwensis TaxID=202772 RepID=A0A4P9VRF9_9GAMM|nr:hypothetical protein [Zooshikella ganghwensis]MBU2704781.1 hypothetical protein [Zooshikella ganghwensis]RDH45207.1 hypothetical protein B9G39_18140 [Zooshikella ganghwensis]